MHSSTAHMIGRCVTAEQLAALCDHFDKVIDTDNMYRGVKYTGNRRTLYFTCGARISVPKELLKPGGRAS
jgi:hypothetical protein